ncbi:Aste57867_9811 [Aphanomyces stellatus]|uniref:Aste57867_9811 protein n=1 Tax=Aphanomyces stellatus TaxID=120398 RepID=A0A485KNT8_9STRA|nr:hypothetical protein As57867_009772 [Aphanomyces stellatus]VFT86690.1 Aste57867_9811 [Aphanomyces stellatus]
MAPNQTYQSIPTAEDTAAKHIDDADLPQPAWTTRRILLVGSLALVCLSVAVGLWRFTQSSVFASMVKWEQEHEAIGIVIFVLVYALCIVCCCPSTIFDLLAGYIFGFGFGNVAAIAGKSLGSVISYLLGRYLMQDAIRKKLQDGQPMFRAWSILLERDEFQFVVLLQFAYIPIFLKNYGLAILNVSFSLFFWSSITVGGARTWLTVYIGSTATHMAELFTKNASGATSHLPEEILIVVGIVSTFVLLLYGSYRTRQYLDELAAYELAHHQLEINQVNKAAME